MPKRHINGCEEFVVESVADLVKVKEGYYVPWDYLFWSDTDEPMGIGEEEHVNASIPKVTFDQKTKKYKLDFIGADGGGYDVQSFAFYFDSKDEILKAIGID